MIIFLTSLEESIFIRQKSKNTKIILLNGIINLTKNDFYKILNFKIIPVINSFDELKKFNSFFKKKQIHHIHLFFILILVSIALAFQNVIKEKL